VTDNQRQWDPWSLPTAILWIVFFFAGLDPERLFYLLRGIGRVDVLTAMVNSSHFITLAFSAYLGLYAYQRCREHGLSPIDAKARALQFGLLGLVAFLSFSMLQLLHLPDIPVPNLRVLVVVVAFAKVSAWFYLLIVVLRYSVLGHDDVFANITSLFPSTYRHGEAGENLGKASSVAWIDPHTGNITGGPTRESGFTEEANDSENDESHGVEASTNAPEGTLK
jgi:hypothetical protein